MFRVAGWPIETIEGINSAAFTSAVDNWIQQESEIEREGHELSEQLYVLIPSIADKQLRGKVLALRRALHRKCDPVTVSVELPDSISRQLSEHLGRRNRHAEQKASLARQYETALQTERAALQSVVADNEFRKAICLASPGTYVELMRQQQAQPDWRLTRTLLQFALRAVGRPTPNGLWAGVGLEDGASDVTLRVEPSEPLVRFAPRLRYFQQAFLTAVPGGTFPTIYEDAWIALSRLLPQIPCDQWTRWNIAISELRDLCSFLATSYQTLLAVDFEHVLTSAHAIVNDLLKYYNLALLQKDECALVADSTASFRFRVSRDFRDQIGRAIEKVWQFDRLGTGERDAKGKRRRLLCAAAEIDETEMTSQWEAEMAGVFSNSRHRLSTSVTQGPMPPGSALLRFDPSDATTIRLGCISADTGLFYGRFHHLFRDTGKYEFLNWHQSELRRIESKHTDIRFADLGLPNPSDWNAAARPNVTEVCIDRDTVSPASISEGLDGLPHLRSGDGGNWIVPLLSSAVSLHTSDDSTQRLASIGMLLGHPILLRPLTILPKERAEWRHLPRLDLDGQITIGAERWIMPEDESSQLASLQGFERFIHWRRYVIGHRLPDVVYAITGLENTESLVPCSSVLAVEVLARTIAGKAVELRLQEAYPDPRTAWLTGTDGKHYVSEIAAAWVGDDEFWSRYSTLSAQTPEVSHVVREEFHQDGPDVRFNRAFG